MYMCIYVCGARGNFQKNCVRPQGLNQRYCEAQLKKLCLQYAEAQLKMPS